MGITPKLVVVGVDPVSGGKQEFGLSGVGVDPLAGGKQEFRLSGVEQVVLLCCFTLAGVSGSEPDRRHRSFSHLGHILVALAVQPPGEETTENLSLLQ